jgi:hypothetical protein
LPNSILTDRNTSSSSAEAIREESGKEAQQPEGAGEEDEVMDGVHYAAGVISSCMKAFNSMFDAFIVKSA